MKRLKITYNHEKFKHSFYITYSKYAGNEISYQNISNIAKSYFLAGEKCIFEEDNLMGGVISLTLPSLVNHLFSIELFFKAFYLYEGNSDLKRGHDLKKLFDNLRDEHKSTIEDEFTIRFSNIKDNLKSAKEVILNDKNVDSSLQKEILQNLQQIIDLSFGNFLERVSNFYINIRYDFEKSADTNYLDIPIFILASLLYELFEGIVKT